VTQVEILEVNKPARTEQAEWYKLNEIFAQIERDDVVVVVECVVSNARDEIVRHVERL
jgi:hypothetical protein